MSTWRPPLHAVLDQNTYAAHEATYAHRTPAEREAEETRILDKAEKAGSLKLHITKEEYVASLKSDRRIRGHGASSSDPTNLGPGVHGHLSRSKPSISEETSVSGLDPSPGLKPDFKLAYETNSAQNGPVRRVGVARSALLSVSGNLLPPGHRLGPEPTREGTQAVTTALQGMDLPDGLSSAERNLAHSRFTSGLDSKGFSDRNDSAHMENAGRYNLKKLLQKLKREQDAVGKGRNKSLDDDIVYIQSVIRGLEHPDKARILRAAAKISLQNSNEIMDSPIRLGFDSPGTSGLGNSGYPSTTLTASSSTNHSTSTGLPPLNSFPTITMPASSSHYSAGSSYSPQQSTLPQISLRGGPQYSNLSHAPSLSYQPSYSNNSLLPPGSAYPLLTPQTGLYGSSGGLLPNLGSNYGGGRSSSGLIPNSASSYSGGMNSYASQPSSLPYGNLAPIGNLGGGLQPQTGLFQPSMYSGSNTLSYTPLQLPVPSATSGYNAPPNAFSSSHIGGYNGPGGSNLNVDNLSLGMGNLSMGSSSRSRANANPQGGNRRSQRHQSPF